MRNGGNPFSAVSLILILCHFQRRLKLSGAVKIWFSWYWGATAIRRHVASPRVCRSRPPANSRPPDGHRLVSSADQKVTFRWRDSGDNNEQKLMTLSLDEFLSRFLLHLLPKGFVRIRNFGFLANRRRSTLLPLCRQLLGVVPQPQIEPAVST